MIYVSVYDCICMCAYVYMYINIYTHVYVCALISLCKQYLGKEKLPNPFLGLLRDPGNTFQKLTLTNS